MRISPDGIALIKSFEGCKLEAYLCPAGVPTIGWGSTLRVRMGDKITQTEADRRVLDELARYEFAVEDAIARPPGVAAAKPTQNQFDAMVSLCYNIGPGHFRTSSVIRRFVQGDITGAAQAFLMWNKGRAEDGTLKVLPGLVKRRKAELAMFLGVQSTSENA